MLKLWLPPNVWFQGSQSTRTGGLAFRNGQTCSSIFWLEQSMRWVLSTPFGNPVDPDVKRIFATVSGVTRARALSTADPGVVCKMTANSSADAPLGGSPLTTNVTPL